MLEPESTRLDDSDNKRNGSSHNSHEEKETGLQKIQSKFELDGSVAEAGQYLDRPGQPNCIYYLRNGSCGYGTNCRYNHPTNVPQIQDTTMYGLRDELPERDGEPDCRFFLKTGTCKYGSSCKYNHPKDRNVASPMLFSILGLPMRPEENLCKFYMRTGQCKFGPACKFHHPQPAASGPVFPVNGISPLGSAEIRSSRRKCRYYMNYGTCKYGKECKYNHPNERIVQMLPQPLNPSALPASSQSNHFGEKGDAFHAQMDDDLVKQVVTLKIMSYNVWFREDLEMHARMGAIGDLIQLHSPDVICLQEVTPDIYELFRSHKWWKGYRCSLTDSVAQLRSYFCMQLSKLPSTTFSTKPFGFSAMGRELCVADAKTQTGQSLVIATSHLESPCPRPPTWDQMFSKERVQQAKEAVNFLKNYPNAILCGDMNWDDERDGSFPIDEGWVDAWMELRPGEAGWTYDTKSNKMISGNRPLQKRLDRFLCCFRDFKISDISMIGMEALPDLSYVKENKLKGEIKRINLPVLPSDHYGLLLTVTSI